MVHWQLQRRSRRMSSRAWPRRKCCRRHRPRVPQPALLPDAPCTGMPATSRGKGLDRSCSGDGFDVLVQVEQIVRVILFFDLCQAIIVGTVSGGHPIAFFFRHEVNVGAIGSVWGGGLEEGACPGNASLIVCSLIPSPVYVEHKLCVPMTICHGIWPNAIGCAGDETDEGLTLRRGHLAGELNH